MTFVQFVSAFGLGAIVTAFLQAWFSHKAEISKRDFQEKKECYVGFLDALHKSEIEQTEEAAKYVGYWALRIDLVGSDEVRRCCVRIQETNPTEEAVHPERPEVMRILKEAMRKDLGVGK